MDSNCRVAVMMMRRFLNPVRLSCVVFSINFIIGVTYYFASYHTFQSPRFIIRLTCHCSFLILKSPIPFVVPSKPSVRKNCSCVKSRRERGNMEFGDYDDDSSVDETPEKHPLSPPSGAESLFLAGLGTAQLSAVALSETIKSNHRSRTFSSDRSLYSARSMATDDFASCADTVEDIDDSMEDNSPRRFVLPGLEEEGIFDMSTSYSNSKYAVPGDTTTYSKPKDAAPSVTTPMKSTPPTESSESGPLKIDAAETVYSKAKDVWAWGKTVPVVSVFVGTAEAVASKAFGVAGLDFSTMDGKIAEQLEKLDTGVLNPALEAIAKALLSVGNSETLKPFVMAILKPLGLIKSDAAETTPDVHSPPEVTASSKK